MTIRYLNVKITSLFLSCLLLHSIISILFLNEIQLPTKIGKVDFQGSLAFAGAVFIAFGFIGSIAGLIFRQNETREGMYYDRVPSQKNYEPYSEVLRARKLALEIFTMYCLLLLCFVLHMKILLPLELAIAVTAMTGLLQVLLIKRNLRKGYMKETATGGFWNTVLPAFVASIAIFILTKEDLLIDRAVQAAFQTFLLSLCTNLIVHAFFFYDLEFLKIFKFRIIR